MNELTQIESRLSAALDDLETVRESSSKMTRMISSGSSRHSRHRKR